MSRRDAFFLLAAVTLLCLVWSDAVHPAIAPICLVWLVVQRAVIEPARIRLPEVAMALLHTWLGLVFLGFAFLGDRSENGTMDMLELLLAFGAPFLLLKLVAPPSRFNDALGVLSCLVLALGSAATAPGYRPLGILVAFLATLCWTLPVLVQREPSAGDSPRIRVVGRFASWAWLPHVAAAGLTLAGLAGGLVLYVLVPRLGPDPRAAEDRAELAIERRAAAGRTRASGFARTMKLGDIGRIKQDDRVAFEAQLTYYGRPFDPPPARRTMLLLRARAWNRYAGGEWRRDVGRGARIGRNGRLEGGDTPVDWRMKMHGYDGRTVFLPQRARRIRSPGVALRADPAGSILAARPLREYGVEAGDPVTSRVDVRRLAVDRREAVHLEVPAHLRPCLRALLPEYLDMDVDDRIAAVHRIFTHGGFRYTLDLPDSLPEDMDPIEAFAQRREGHCELFASAACLMLRLMDVPARMAGGVRLAERVAEGRYLARYRNAHAWVEVPFHGAGFVAFDFTPPDRRAVTPSSELGPNAEDEAALSLGEREGEGGGTGEEPGFDWRRPFAFTAADQARMRKRIGTWASAVPAKPLLWGALALVGVVLLRSLAKRRTRSPLRVRAPAGTPARRFAFYRKWLKRCASKGHRRKPQQTPREFLAALPAPLREEGADITDRFERLRYGSL